MEYTIERAKLGDEETLAYIQTESWKAGFREILDEQTLQRCTQLDRATAMYRRLLEAGIGNGYLLRVEGSPHCIVWWDATREKDMPSYAELICIHSLQNRWRMGFGSRMMEAVLRDAAAAGYEKIMLWVFEKNARARRFYESNGFSPNGRTQLGLGAVEICYERAM